MNPKIEQARAGVKVELKIHFGKEMVVIYTNWEGNKDKRKIIPQYLWKGCTRWHPNVCWLLRVWDVTKADWRDFALEEIEAYEAEVEGIGEDRSS